MKIIVKKLQGADCVLEVNEGTFILDIKREIFNRLGIPIEEQRLLLLGKTLADEQTVHSYPLIKDGTKLNLIIKKPDGLYEVVVKELRCAGYLDAEAVKISTELMKVMQRKFNELSWDDVERLVVSCMEDEINENVMDCEM